MYIVMNRIKSPPEFSEHLERAFRHAGSMQDVPGFVSFQFMRNTREADQGGAVEYVALTQWNSRDAFEAWKKSEAFSRAHEGAENSPVTSELDTYEVLG
ncbi:MAG: antibiotic biosynthesis monooxygenase [Chloroflexi bacterium]|jgi:heme-degrading monooxygenase HmoA|nr:antibiotic biosynthesis monooxygenase [Chloroflexota bacterium]